MAYLESFEPLRITALFRCGIVVDEWFPLDGVLLYQASRLACGVQQATLPGGGGEEQKYNVSVPLLIHNPNQPDWFYACSWAYPRPWWRAEGKDYWNKRFDNQFADMIDFSSKRGKIDVSSGRFKSYRMPIFYRVTDKVTWYCVGHKERITALLSTLTHLGKKTTQGWGRVIRWEIDPIKDDYSIWKDGQLTRGIPGKLATGKGVFNLANYGVRAPYYRRDNQMLLAMPE